MREPMTPYIHAILEGDEQAFRFVYEETKYDVYRTVRYLTNRQEDVGDIVNEIYLELIRSLPRYDDRKPFMSWLNGIVVRQTRSWNRKLWRSFRIAEKEKQLATPQQVLEQETPEQRVTADEQSQELSRMLLQLSYKLRVVIVLRYYQERTFPEIAEALGIPVGTVKSRHDLAIRKLRAAAKANVMKEAFARVI